MRRGAYAGRGPRGYRRSDERIREDINDRLTDDGRVDASDIEVTVNNGMVTLTGRLDGREEKRRAEDIAERVSGVADVSNQLRVGRSVLIESEAETAGGLAPEPRGPEQYHGSPARFACWPAGASGARASNSRTSPSVV